MFENTELLKLVQNFSQMMSIVEAEIVQCRRSVFVGIENDVLAEMKYLALNYRRRQFYIPNDYLTTLQGYWSFMHFGESKVPQYFHLIVSAGIYDKLHAFRTNKEYLRRRKNTLKLKAFFNESGDIDPMNIHGPIRTLFYLCAIMISSALSLWILENLNAYGMRFVRKLYVACIYEQKKFNRRLRRNRFRNRAR